MAIYGEDEPLLLRNVVAARHTDITQVIPPEDTLSRSQAKAQSSRSLTRHPLFFALGAGALIVAGFMIRTGTLNHRHSSSYAGIGEASLLQEGGPDKADWPDVASGSVADSAGDRRQKESWRSAHKISPGVGGKIEERNEDSVGRTSKPNVFVFLIDDMGFGDIGYQSTDLSEMTPNLDALAEGGIKLSNYYSMSLCTPARASLMTGRYPVRYGLQYSVLMPGAPWGLPLDEKVLPAYMNDAGYESHMVGKWHLGSYNDASIPSRRGFKTFLGYLNGEEYYYSHKNYEAYLDGQNFYDFGFGNETDYYDITSAVDGMACTGLEQSPVNDATSPTESCYVGTYSTDAFSARARQVVKEKTPWDKEPLFLYMAHQSVHAPVGPVPSDAFTEAEQALLDALDSAVAGKRNAFAGVLMYLDKQIGKFIDFLEAGGWLENSIIVVASDNGGCPDDGGSNYPLRGAKQSLFEGGTRVPAFVYSRSHIPQDLWGTTYSKMMHVTDWVPTLASAVGGRISGSAGALDGVDHWNSLLGIGEAGDSTNGPRNEMLYNWDPYLLSSTYELRENFNRTQGAFRQGKWKVLVNVFCSGYYCHDLVVMATDPLMDASVACGDDISQCQDCIDWCQRHPSYLFSDRLVNLEEDPREEKNLILEYPEIASMLKARAEEVAFSEWTSSNYLEINTDSYQVWKAHDWWMVPWTDCLSPES